MAQGKEHGGKSRKSDIVNPEWQSKRAVDSKWDNALFGKIV
jgi:hypothetical protein